MCAINSSTTATASSGVVTTLGEEDKPKAILSYLACTLVAEKKTSPMTLSRQYLDLLLFVCVFLSVAVERLPCMC